MATKINWIRINQWEKELVDYVIKKHNEFHWKLKVAGQIVDLWPSTRKFSINGEKAQMANSTDDLLKKCNKYRESIGKANLSGRNVGSYAQSFGGQSDLSNMQLCSAFFTREDVADDDPITKMNIFFDDFPSVKYVDVKIRYNRDADALYFDQIHSIVLMYLKPIKKPF